MADTVESPEVQVLEKLERRITLRMAAEDIGREVDTRLKRLARTVKADGFRPGKVPMSVVAHDDVHLFESIQQGLQAMGNPWVSLHRNYQDNESAQTSADTNSANEWLMRNQYRAWAQAMLQPLASEDA